MVRRVDPDPVEDSARAVRRNELGCFTGLEVSEAPIFEVFFHYLSSMKCNQYSQCNHFMAQPSLLLAVEI